MADNRTRSSEPEHISAIIERVLADLAANCEIIDEPEKTGGGSNNE